MRLSALGLAFGLLLVAAAGIAWFARAPWPVIGWAGGFGCLAIFGTVFERVRYKYLAPKPPGLGWEATQERFRDPETGRWVRVYFKPETGERVYVATDVTTQNPP
jgi:hypothetical protein